LFMDKIWSTLYQEGFERAFQEMKIDYHRTPLTYLTKEDVVASLYLRMRTLNKAREVTTGRYTIAKDGRWRAKKVEVRQVHMSPLHVMVGKDMDEKPRADLCFMDLSTMQVSVTARYSKKRPTSLAGWRFETGLGISVVMNTSVQYAKRVNTRTGRASKTEGLKELEKEITRVISDLMGFERSILLFMDHNSLFTKTELEVSFSKRLDPYTMRMYYLTPRSGFHITGRRTGSSDQDDQ